MRPVQPHLVVLASHYETNTPRARMFGPPAVSCHVIGSEDLAVGAGAAAALASRLA